MREGLHCSRDHNGLQLAEARNIMQRAGCLEPTIARNVEFAKANYCLADTCVQKDDTHVLAKTNGMLSGIDGNCEILIFTVILKLMARRGANVVFA
eukprot:1151460-Pelagomonas_calceolata.AAC.4